MGTTVPESVRQIISNSSLDTDEKVSRLVDIGKPLIPWLLSSLHPSDTYFNISFRTLSSLGSSAIPGLLKKVKSKNRVISQFAARALVSIGAETTDYIRSEFLKSDEKNQTRLLRVLGSVRSLDSLDIIINAFNSKSYPVRNAAKHSLIKLGFPGRKALIKTLENYGVATSNIDKDDLESTLARIAVLSTDQLVDVLKNKNINFASRSIAATILGRSLNISFFNKLFNRKNKELRALALIGLTAVTAKEALPLLKAGLHDQDVFVKTTAIQVVTSRRFSHERVFFPDLIEMLSSENSIMRCEIVRCLGEHYWDESVEPALINRLWDEDNAVCEQAVIALGSHDFLYQFRKLKKPVLDRVLDFVKSNNDKTRMASFNILCNADSRYATKLIRGLLFSANLSDHIRLELVKSLVANLYVGESRKEIIHDMVKNPNENTTILNMARNSLQKPDYRKILVDKLRNSSIKRMQQSAESEHNK